MTHLLIVFSLLGAIPGSIASQKGRNFFIWWVFGTTLFIIALPLAILITPLHNELAANKNHTHIPAWLTIIAVLGIGFFWGWWKIL